MVSMSPRVVGEDANIDGIYVPPDKKKKKIKETLHFLPPKKKPFITNTKECSPDHFEPKLDTGVFQLIKHETDEVFAYMDEDANAKENKRKAYRRKNVILYEAPEKELQQIGTRHSMGWTQKACDTLEKQTNCTISDLLAKKDKFNVK